MANALLSGVSGLKAHQNMLDVAGNNLANVNTLAFKGSRVTFAELLGQTVREASQPTGSTGGRNPLEIGGGVTLASVDRVMKQGSLYNTGQSLDMAIEGEGYFVLNDGQRDVYTRAGTFSVDASNYLVDSTTGFRVQRIGYEGVAEGFQDPASANIRIPFDATLPSRATESVTFSGSLTAGEDRPTTNLLTSGMQYSVDGSPVSDEALLADLDQASGLAVGDEIRITGTDRAGADVDVVFTVADTAADTVGDLLAAVEGAFAGTTASLVNGQIQVADNETGYSRTDVMLDYSGAGSFELPDYFRVLTAGGQAVQNTDVEIFDSQGVGHILSASFVRTSDPNAWDLVLTNMTGGVEALADRRIENVTFNSSGAYAGVDGDDPSFEVVFANDPGTTRTVTMNLGTIGGFDGVCLSGGDSTVAATDQDGYAAGRLTGLSVTGEGTLIGTFSNGERQDIAALKLATFQNPAGLKSVGNNHYTVSGNSGEPVPTRGLGGNAGAVRGGTLEKSNVEVAAEFVNLIQAQNGFQANARTIRVANELLRELSNLIR